LHALCQCGALETSFSSQALVNEAQGSRIRGKSRRSVGLIHTRSPLACVKRAGFKSTEREISAARRFKMGRGDRG
jgi:hypothetical protein